MKALLRALGAAGLVLGVVALPAAYAVDAAAGRDLLVVEARDAASVELERGLWELNGSKKEGVAEIYGTPRPPALRMVFVPKEKILHPKEDPSLALYLKAAGDHPTQSQTLYYFALPAAIGGIVVGAGLLFAASRLKPRVSPAA